MFFIFLLGAIDVGAQEEQPSRVIVRPFLSFGMHDMIVNNLDNYYEYGEGKTVYGADVEGGFLMKGGVDVSFFLNNYVGLTAGVSYGGHRWRLYDKYGAQSNSVPGSFRVFSRQRWLQFPVGVCVKKDKRAVGLYAAAGASVWLLQDVFEQLAEGSGSSPQITERKGKLSNYRQTSYAAFSELTMTVRITPQVSVGTGIDLQYQISNNFSSDYQRGHFVTFSGKLSLLLTL
jgi:hypothetical protein